MLKISTSVKCKCGGKAYLVRMLGIKKWYECVRCWNVFSDGNNC